MSRYLIIGAGAAGISAAEAIRSEDPFSEIVQICEETAGYYSRPGLAYYLTGEINEDCLYPFKDADFARLNVKLIKAQVSQIRTHEQLVELKNGRALSYQRLLIATGARAAVMKIPGIELEGVVKLDTIEDAHKLLKMAKRRRTAVVVGGGITALELVEGFRARGLNVHYLLRGDRYWSNVLDETESHIVECRLKDEGIKIHYHTEVAEILGKHGKVVGVLTASGEVIKCDIVGIAIGIKPKKELAESAGIKVERGIIVDEYLQTSDKNIFAAGDVAQVYDPVAKQAILDSLWGPARNQGYVAGINLTGKRNIYYKAIPFNVTRLAGLTTTIIGALGGHDIDADVVGIVRGESETWRQMPDAIVAQSNFNINRIRIFVGEDKLVGALLMGDQTLSRALNVIISHKIDISSIRAKILDSRNSISDVIGDFWNEISPIYGKMEHATIKP